MGDGHPPQRAVAVQPVHAWPSRRSAARPGSPPSEACCRKSTSTARAALASARNRAVCSLSRRASPARTPLDGDPRRAGHDVDQPPVLRTRIARLPVVVGERPQHPPLRGQDRAWTSRSACRAGRPAPANAAHSGSPAMSVTATGSRVDTARPHGPRSGVDGDRPSPGDTTPGRLRGDRPAGSTLPPSRPAGGWPQPRRSVDCRLDGPHEEVEHRRAAASPRRPFPAPASGRPGRASARLPLGHVPCEAAGVDELAVPPQHAGVDQHVLDRPVLAPQAGRVLVQLLPGLQAARGCRRSRPRRRGSRRWGDRRTPPGCSRAGPVRPGWPAGWSRPARPSAGPTVAFSKKSASSRSLRRSSCSARRCSVTSRKTSTTPIISPAASRIGAAESSMGRSVPSLAIRTVWFASPTTTPSRSTFSTGFSTGCRVCSLTMGNTASSGCPCASSCVQPVSSSATRVQERHPPLGVRGDDRIADAGERHPQPLPLLVQPLLGGLPFDPDGDLVGHRRHRLQAVERVDVLDDEDGLVAVGRRRRAHAWLPR